MFPWRHSTEFGQLPIFQYEHSSKYLPHGEFVWARFCVIKRKIVVNRALVRTLIFGAGQKHFLKDFEYYFIFIKSQGVRPHFLVPSNGPELSKYIELLVTGIFSHSSDGSGCPSCKF